MRLRHFGLAVALLCAASAPALAQYSTAPQASKRFKGQNQPNAGSLPPPSALPGATPTFAPAEKTDADLAPTEALFDAINRGDIASAKDALGRGADINAHSVLGMTPLELSVDLSRNDITFLLLSLRGSDTRAVAATQGTKPVPGKVMAGATKPATAKVAAKPASKPAAPMAQAAAQAATASRQYAGPSDTGTPAPQAGFLGFGGGNGTVQ